MLLARSLLVLVLATPLLSADVLVGDAGGGGDFTPLTAAVAAAVNGDTILVRDGEYAESGPVVVDGKALTIAGEFFDPGQGPPTVLITPGLVVRNLQPGKLVVLENLLVAGAAGSSTAAASAGLVLRDNNSHVRAQSCVFVGGSGSHNSNPDGAPGLEILDNYSTAMTRCSLLGGSGQFSPNLGVVAGDGGPGASLDGGQLHVSHSAAVGGYGGSNIIGGWPQGGVGGAGVVNLAGTLIVVSGSMNGGQGGTAHNGGDGGHGLEMASPGFAWLLAGSFASGGDGGTSDEGPHGADGADILDPGGLVTDFGGLPHGFDVSSPLREGHQGVLDFDGQSSDTTLLFASLSVHQLPFPAKQGVFMLFPSALIGPIVLGAGSGQLPFLAPTLPAVLEAVNVHLQAVYTGVDGVVIGPGRVLTLLDASF